MYPDARSPSDGGQRRFCMPGWAGLRRGPRCDLIPIRSPDRCISCVGADVGAWRMYRTGPRSMRLAGGLSLPHPAQVPGNHRDPPAPRTRCKPPGHCRPRRGSSRRGEGRLPLSWMRTSYPRRPAIRRWAGPQTELVPIAPWRSWSTTCPIAMPSVAWWLTTSMPIHSSTGRRCRYSVTSELM